MKLWYPFKEEPWAGNRNSHGRECRRNLWAPQLSAENATSVPPLLLGSCFLENISVLRGIQVGCGVLQVQADHQRFPDQENQGELWGEILKVFNNHHSNKPFANKGELTIGGKTSDHCHVVANHQSADWIVCGENNQAADTKTNSPRSAPD